MLLSCCLLLGNSKSCSRNLHETAGEGEASRAPLTEGERVTVQRAPPVECKPLGESRLNASAVKARPSTMEKITGWANEKDGVLPRRVPISSQAVRPCRNSPSETRRFLYSSTAVQWGWREGRRAKDAWRTGLVRGQRHTSGNLEISDKEISELFFNHHDPACLSGADFGS